ncbi:MAG: ORF6N domain-containing protein [Bacteroidetes bacterium]|nr:ORF6N domain-containing protein [Bacteroidota bacterium]
MQVIKSIQNRIYELRGERVMLDRDLADLYEIEVRVLNQAVKRNIKRFPDDFMFQLTQEEYDSLRFQIETLENSPNLRSQIVISSLRTERQNLKSQFVISSLGGQWGGARHLPYAFTEQGVAMLSGILNSDKAIQMNISIMRAFVEVRKIMLRQNDLKEQLREIRARMTEHDAQLGHIYDAMENLLDETAAQRKWDNRERIGFNK